MKKIVLIIIAATIIIIICTVPVTNRVAVTINASYVNTFKELTDIKNWKKWQEGYVEKDSSLYILSTANQSNKLIIPGGLYLIKQEGSNSLLVKKVLENTSYDYSFTVIPGTQGVLTTIIVSFKTSLLKYLLPGFKKHELNKTSINDFKKFMENTSLYYGFNIKQDFEKERKIIVRKKTIAAARIYVEAAKVYKQLQQYILLRNVTQAAPTMMQFNRKNGDSVQLLMGIPVNKQIKTDNGFLYMDIPATKVLVADFKGKYRDKQKIYSAMANYIQDKYLHPKIAPLELYRGKLPVSDTSVTQFQLTYPIY